MSDKSNYAFVSDNGRVIGVGTCDQPPVLTRGTALAYLDEPTDLTTWASTIRRHEDLQKAVDEMVLRLGGVRVVKEVQLNNAVVLPYIGNDVVPEA